MYKVELRIKNERPMIKNIIPILLVILTCSCKQNTARQTSIMKEDRSVPVFCADSSYQYTVDQVSFGPRVPNTQAHKDCGNYLSDKLRLFGAEVVEQEAILRLEDNSLIEIRNIIGSFDTENANRVLLFAHWDSRPYADHDPNPDNWNTPIDGANDGAGACAVLLEIARQINIEKPKIGIDIIFFDAEDWGPPDFEADNKHYGDWCMGSEYWARNPHKINYTARYGILLDMVSAPGAQFFQEGVSLYYARNIVQKVWDTAQEKGYGNFFLNTQGSQTNDDHVPVNLYRKIPSIDIIQQDQNSRTGFGSYWHTLDDNISNVSKETMQAVGQTVLHVLYNE